MIIMLLLLCYDYCAFIIVLLLLYFYYSEMLYFDSGVGVQLVGSCPNSKLSQGLHKTNEYK